MPSLLSARSLKKFLGQKQHVPGETLQLSKTATSNSTATNATKWKGPKGRRMVRVEWYQGWGKKVKLGEKFCESNAPATEAAHS